MDPGSFSWPSSLALAAVADVDQDTPAVGPVEVLVVSGAASVDLGVA